METLFCHTRNHISANRMNIQLFRHFLLASILLATATFGFGQTAAGSFVNERDVRAQMNFLAGDAMQGRGSGTLFERIAAEYIGSQFMQFGLEPAGENGPDGKPTYVQTVNIPGREELKSIRIKGDAGRSITFGKDLVVFALTSKQISGELQRAKPGDTLKKGAVVLLMLGPDDEFEKIQPSVADMMKAGPVAIIMAETKEIRKNWGDVAQRRSPVSRRGGASLMAVSGDAVNALSGVTDGTLVEFETEFAAGKGTQTWNAMGKITGTDRTLGSEVILLTSHLDHLGVRENTPGDDKIFNGADDDASGSVAVLELARVLGSGKRPKRTVYFVCFGSEEAGGYGASYFVNNMPFLKEKLVANLEFEMIGRPDAKVKAEELWLTGYERSNLGPELAKRGAKLVQDPHPDQNFFFRSDNIQLARAGIIAHTVSSFGLHTDYHKASDEVKTIDFSHMTRSINSMIKPVQWLINSNFKPTWNEGKRP